MVSHIHRKKNLEQIVHTSKTSPASVQSVPLAPLNLTELINSNILLYQPDQKDWLQPNDLMEKKKKKKTQMVILMRADICSVDYIRDQEEQCEKN